MEIRQRITAMRCQAKIAQQFAFLVFFIAGSAGLAQSGVIVVKPPRLQEIVRDSVETNGVPVAGLTGPLLRSRLRRTELVISGLTSLDTNVCITIERSSGLYLANFSVTVPPRSSTLRIRLEGSRLERFDALTGEFAIRARATSTDCPDSGPLLPVIWAEAGPRPQALSLFVNSIGADSVQVLNAQDKRARPVHCTGLRQLTGRSLSTRNFDKVCNIAPPACGSTSIFKIYRRYGRELRLPETIALRGWC